jgi:hypothetical protein
MKCRGKNSTRFLFLARRGVFVVVELATMEPKQEIHIAIISELLLNFAQIFATPLSGWRSIIIILEERLHTTSI